MPNRLINTIKARPGLSLLFALQAFCAVSILLDAIGDIFEIEEALGYKESDTFELLIALAMIASVVFSAVQLFRYANRNQKVEDQLMAASGAFADLMDDKFAEWGLTRSERDVALLAIKGLEIAEIAALRDTRVGTIKAQLNAIYRKAKVSGRPQLISLFIEDLLTEPVAPQIA